MIKKVSILLSCVCLVLAKLPLHAQSQGVLPLAVPFSKGQIIRVVSDNNYPPYVFLDKKGRLQGIVVDQWRAWESATGMKVDIQGFDWVEAQKQLAEGRADAIDTMFKTPERELTLLFSKPYATLEVPVFFHESISGIATIEDLTGFKIAVKDGDACIGILLAHGIDTLVTYPSYEAIIAAAAAGIEKVFCIDQPPAQYYLAKAGISDQYRFALTLYTGYFHRAVSKKNPLLLRQIDEGFALIPEAVYKKIDQRWRGTILSSRINPKLLAAIAGSIGLILALALGAIIVAWFLKRKVQEKTLELASTIRELKASEATNNAIFEAQPDILFVMDESSRFLEYKSPDISKLAVKPEAFLLKTVDEVFHSEKLTKDNAKAIQGAFREGGVHVVEYSLPYPDGAHFFESRIVKLDDAKVLSIVRDVSAAKAAETNLRASLAEKEALLREIHHRVKNNLQIVSSLLSLQAEKFQSQFDRDLFAESQGRIKAMAQVHERLYNSSDFSFISAGDYVRDLVKEIASTWFHENLYINIEIEATDISFELEKAVSIGLILNELITNAYKYAFIGGQDNVLRVHIEHSLDNGLLLAVSDNGRGMPAGFNPEKSGGMGFTIIRALCDQLHASIILNPVTGPEANSIGTEIVIQIPHHKQA